MKKTEQPVAATETAMEAAPKKKVTRARKTVAKKTTKAKKEPAETPATEPEAVTTPEIRATAENTLSAPVQTVTEEATKEEETPAEKPVETPKAAENLKEEKPAETAKPRTIAPSRIKPLCANLNIKDFRDLVNNAGRIPMLGDQQIQQLSYDEAIERIEVLEGIIRNVLDYDIVLSDTNIWLELLVGKSSSYSDPRVNARLQFERQLETISKMAKRIGGKFMIMSETYEEVDRFSATMDPINYKDADWNDEGLCRNVAARLAKRLMLIQQKENRLRIEGIGSETHHSSFADPVIIRRTVELFAEGYKVLLLTNDTSVGIRSLGMCDDLQRVNKIDDKTWREVYEPQRPMVLTFEDLKLLDTFTRQYHFLLLTTNRPWMQDVTEREKVQLEKPLEPWLEGFRTGDRYERRNDRDQQRKEQQKRDVERKEQQRKEQQRADQERREAQRKADRERAAARKKEEQDSRKAKDGTDNTAEKVNPEVTATAVAETQTLPATTSSAETLAAETPANAPVASTTPETEEKKKSTRRGGRSRRPAKGKKSEE